MPRKKRIVTIDDIDVTTIPFQSRTTLGQYLLKMAEEREKRANKVKEQFLGQIKKV